MFNSSILFYRIKKKKKAMGCFSCQLLTDFSYPRFIPSYYILLFIHLFLCNISRGILPCLQQSNTPTLTSCYAGCCIIERRLVQAVYSILWKNTCLSVSYLRLLSTDNFQTPQGKEPGSSLWTSFMHISISVCRHWALPSGRIRLSSKQTSL